MVELEIIETLALPVAKPVEMPAGPAAHAPGGQREEYDARVSSADAAPAAADGNNAAVEALAPDKGVVAGDSAPVVLVESLSCGSTPSVLEVRLEFPPKVLEASGERSGAGVRREAGDTDGGLREGFDGVVAGDFVWGQPKGGLWWPGQVFDSTAASEKAAEERPENGHCVLVAYFGDGSFGWCDPSQLKPFVTEFEKMVRQSSAKSFARAVSLALDEFERYLKLEMSCRCVPEEVLLKLDRPLAANAGLKNGVTAPEGRNFGMAIVSAVPLELLQRFRALACDASITNILEITVIRSWVAALFHGMGRHAPLPEYNTYKGIPQVKEKGRHSSPLALTGSLGRGSVRKAGIVDGPEVSEGGGMKQRSMAELIAGMDLDMDDEGLVKSETLIRKRKKEVEGKGSDAENGDVGAEEGAGSGRRERKKSKYLSPPYTMIAHESKRSAISKSSERKMTKKELVDTEDSDSDEGKLPEKVSGSHSIVKCSASGQENEKSFVFDEKISPDELLLELRLTALNTLYLVENQFDVIIRGFISKFRSSVYSDGSKLERERKSLASSCDVGMKTLGFETNGSKEGKAAEGFKAKSPGVVEANHPIRQKSDAEITRKSLGHEANGSSEAKPRGRPRKKSVNSLVWSPQEPQSAGSKGTVSAGQEASDSEEGKCNQKRKNKNQEAAQEPHGSKESKPEEGIHKQKRMRRKKNIEGTQEANGSEEGKPKKMERKKKNEEGTQESNGSEEGKPNKKRGRKKKNEEENADPGAALLLSFVTGVELPSKEELISSYSKFGTLSESKTELQKDASCATVVFSRKADAEKAFNCPETDRPFGSTLSTFRLRNLQDDSGTPTVSKPPASTPKPPLEFVKKSLENMITTLSESGLSAKGINGSTGGLKLDMNENLVDEMSGLLKKVNKLLTGSSAAAGATAGAAT